MKNNHKNSGSVLGAAVFGAAAGATVVALAHKPTRKKIKTALISAIENGDKKLDRATKKVTELKDKSRRKAAKELAKAEQRLAQ